MIKVEGLTKRYASHVAVKNISFEVGKGDARITAESFSGDITIRTRDRRPPTPER